MTSSTTAVARLRHNPWALRALLVLLVLAFGVALTVRAGAADAGKKYTVPQSAALESQLGVRFIQAAVVADGGLVELRYTVLDANKASTFQNDTKHPPVLRNPKHPGEAVYRTALMKQGHNLRAGQSYYVLYLNNHAAVRSGQTLEIDAGGNKLANVPVR